LMAGAEEGAEKSAGEACRIVIPWVVEVVGCLMRLEVWWQSLSCDCSEEAMMEGTFKAAFEPDRLLPNCTSLWSRLYRY
jgi:hypothetical protein